MSGLVQPQTLKSSMKAWYGQFAVKNLTGFKHNSVVYKTEKSQKQTIFTKLGAALAQKMLSLMLNLNAEAVEELKKVDAYDFDIFRLRRLTDGNELVTVLPMVLVRHGLVSSCNLDFTKLINFVRKLAAGYKSTITYHN